MSSNIIFFKRAPINSKILLIGVLLSALGSFEWRVPLEAFSGRHGRLFLWALPLRRVVGHILINIEHGWEYLVQLQFHGDFENGLGHLEPSESLVL